MPISFRLSVKPPPSLLTKRAKTARANFMTMLKNEMHMIGKLWVMTEKLEVPIKTGALMESINYKVTDIHNGVRLESQMLNYGFWVSKGAAAHMIKARNKPMLVFYWEKIGRWVKFPWVYHPGIVRPNDFILRTWDRIYPKVESLPLRLAIRYRSDLMR